jgi:predicted CopG family antitoxin
MPVISSLIDDELYTSLLHVAKLEERSVSNFIRLAVKLQVNKVLKQYEQYQQG